VALGKASWTIMVYMVADNDLGMPSGGMPSPAQADIREMESAKPNPAANVVVQVDWPSPRSTQRLLIKDGGREVLKEWNSNLASSKAGFLAEFTQYCRTSFPADRYLLVLWGHGDGVDWLKTSAQAPSKYGDEAGGLFMPLRVLASVLNGPAGMRFDLVGFDACLMNMLEVYYELGNSINRGVGSADEIPIPGWPYETVLSKLLGQPAMEPGKLAQVIVDANVARYSLPGATEKVCFAASPLAWRNQISALLKALTAKLQGAMVNKTMLSKIVQARKGCESYKRNAYVDFYQFCAALAVQPEFKKEARAICAVLDDTYHKHSTTKKIGNSRGLSICLPYPASSSVGLDRAHYASLALCKETGWADFVFQFLDQA